LSCIKFAQDQHRTFCSLEQPDLKKLVSHCTISQADRQALIPAGSLLRENSARLFSSPAAAELQAAWVVCLAHERMRNR
jgi:hypothetical protein